jgi:hypothetical protein
MIRTTPGARYLVAVTISPRAGRQTPALAETARQLARHGKLAVTRGLLRPLVGIAN